jgi:hypothetical protein
MFAGAIHAFCAHLLRKRPVEAGVTPKFTELDEVQDTIRRGRSWRDSLERARADGSPVLRELEAAEVVASVEAGAQTHTTGAAAESLYIPKPQRTEDRRFLRDFMEEFAFVDLVTVSPSLRITHIPVWLDRATGAYGTIHGHISRQNPQSEAFDGRQTGVVVFRGPHGYIPPTWYAKTDNVAPLPCRPATGRRLGEHSARAKPSFLKQTGLSETEAPHPGPGVPGPLPLTTLIASETPPLDRNRPPAYHPRNTAGCSVCIIIAEVEGTPYDLSDR